LVQQLLVNLFATGKDGVEFLRQRITRSRDRAAKARRDLLFERSFLGLQLFHRQIQSQNRTLEWRSRRRNWLFFYGLAWRLNYCLAWRLNRWWRRWRFWSGFSRLILMQGDKVVLFSSPKKTHVRRLYRNQQITHKATY